MERLCLQRVEEDVFPNLVPQLLEVLKNNHKIRQIEGDLDLVMPILGNPYCRHVTTFSIDIRDKPGMVRKNNELFQAIKTSTWVTNLNIDWKVTADLTNFDCKNLIELDLSAYKFMNDEKLIDNINAIGEMKKFNISANVGGFGPAITKLTAKIRYMKIFAVGAKDLKSMLEFLKKDQYLHKMDFFVHALPFTVKQFEQLIEELFVENWNLTKLKIQFPEPELKPAKKQIVTYCKRNRRHLTKIHQYTVLILYNIARRCKELVDLLPKEIWINIFKHLDTSIYDYGEMLTRLFSDQSIRKISIYK